MPLGAVFTGIQGVRGFYESIAAALPDLKIEVRTEYDVDGCSIREVVVSGTLRSSLRSHWRNQALLLIAGF